MSAAPKAPKVVHVRYPDKDPWTCCDRDGSKLSEDELSTDPRGKRCQPCIKALKDSPQLVACVARAAGLRVGDITFGPSPAELERRALRNKTELAAHRNRQRAEALRELARRMAGAS